LLLFFFNVLALLFNPGQLCLFHIFLDFLVGCNVLPYSLHTHARTHARINIIITAAAAAAAVHRNEDDVFQWSVMCPEMTQEPDSSYNV